MQAVEKTNMCLNMLENAYIVYIVYNTLLHVTAERSSVFTCSLAGILWVAHMMAISKLITLLHSGVHKRALYQYFGSTSESHSASASLKPA